MKHIERVLVVRTDRIGDVILTLPMLEVLRKNFPKAHIAVLIRQYTAELLEGNPHVNEVLLYDDGRTPLPFFRMAATLRKKHFDAVFMTSPRFRLARLMFWARIPLRIGTGYRWYSFLLNRRVYHHRKYAEKHEAEYNIDLLKTIGCEVSDAPSPRLRVLPHAKERARSVLSNYGIDGHKPFVLLHPGSGGSARNWGWKNFGVLGRKLKTLAEVQVIVMGGAGEEHIVRLVAETVGNDTPTIVNQVSLQEYAAIASMAAVLIANSTGPLHIAAAVGTPVVGLYPQVTPMSAKRWGPYTDRKTILVPQGKPDTCYTCVRNGTECECMNSIPVEDVFQAAKQYIAVENVHA